MDDFDTLLSAKLGPAAQCAIENTFLRYHRTGSGEPVVFVHGITTYSFIWKEIVPFFKHYDCISVDLLGCGDSDKPLNQSYSLTSHADRLYSFVRELGLSGFHLLCHDVGGGIGQIFAVKYPQLLRSLTLINTVAYDFWPVQPILMMKVPIIRELTMASLDYGIFKLIIKRGLYHKDRLTPDLMGLFWHPLRTSAGRKAFLHFVHCLDNRNLMDIADQLPGLSVPTLLMRGKNDVYLSEEIIDTLQKNIPHAQAVKFDNCGHFMQEDAPQRISDTILTFIEDHHHGP